ncbi:MAG TPA: hypothetical protein VEC96_05975, partial [Anaerolineae bacterium]|nr:hypothetical protein [Anaerolineae bacterium]
MDMIQLPQSNKFYPDGLENGPSSSLSETDQAKLGRLAKEIKEVTTLYNVGVAVGSSLELKEVIRTLYKESSRLIDTSNFAIVIYDENI